MSFLGWIKNGTKHTMGLQMPAFYPASRVTYDGGTVEDALDDNKLIDVSSSVTLTADVSEGAILAKYCKATNQLFLIATTRIRTTSTGSMSNVTIANIASAYRPSYDVKIPVYSATGGNDGISMLYVNTSGSIELVNLGSSATSFYARFNINILLG